MAFSDIENSSVVLAEIDIVANGVCHSDSHMVNNDWGISTYPLIPGTFPSRHNADTLLIEPFGGLYHTFLS